VAPATEEEEPVTAAADAAALPETDVTDEAGMGDENSSPQEEEAE
jgi:hypothetical protein